MPKPNARPLPHPVSKPRVTGAQQRPWRAVIRWTDEHGKRRVKRCPVRRNQEPVEAGEMWIVDMPDDAEGVRGPVTIEVVWR